MELKDLNITAIKTKLQSKELSCKEVAQYFLDRASKSDLNAFVTIDEESTVNHALQSQKRYDADEAGIVEGIPVAIKDLYCTEGVRTTAGSKMLYNFVPPYESTVTAKLYHNGGVPLGKTNMDEFAMGSSNETSFFGPVQSPWKTQEGEPVVPGGSSGGSSAAVAAKLAVAALGSDTGGSIRQPAAFTGTVGVKPTYGRCSRWGMVAFASSLDQAGVFTKSVEDAALVLEAICGYDEKDSTSMNIDVPQFHKSVGKSTQGLKIGIPKEYYMDGMSPELEKNWQQGMQWLKEAGCEMVEISLPHTQYALPTYYIIAPAEASSNLARYDGVRYGHRTEKVVSSLDEMYELTRAEGFGDEVKRRIIIGTYVLSAGYYDAYYKKAQRVRNLIIRDFKDAFSKVNAILTPTAPSTAFVIGAKQDDPLTMYLNDIFTVPASLAGLPGISVPSGLASDGLPLGLQVLANSYDEETMFKVASVLEKASQFKLPF